MVRQARANRDEAGTSGESEYSFGAVLQQPDRARASVQLYRTFLTREVPMLNRYRGQRLTVTTRLLAGERDPVATRTMLAGWEANADDMRVEFVPGAGHFFPEEAPDRIVDLARQTFTA